MGVFRGSVGTILRQVGGLLGGYRKLRRVSGLVKVIVVIGVLFMCMLCAYPLSFFFDDPPPEVETPAVTDSASVDTAGGETGQFAACVCFEDYYDCSDFESQAAAQECYEYCAEQVALFDPHNLDTDGDGVACGGWDYQQ
jgi:hypothetical protein